MLSAETRKPMNLNRAETALSLDSVPSFSKTAALCSFSTRQS